MLTVKSLGKKIIKPQSYTDALSLLEHYSPYTTNLTQIKDLLEQSENENNYDAMVKLGEFWLLGFPIASDSVNTDATLVKDGKFYRNPDLAMYYFKKAFSKSNEASFYVSLLLQQSMLTTAFDKYLPVLDTPVATIKSLEETNLQQLSSMAISAKIFQYERCKSSFPIPNFLQQEQLSYLSFPFYNKPMCGHKCDSLANSALVAASKAIEYIFKNQRESSLMNAIGEDNSKWLYGEDMKNWIKLQEKNFRNHPKGMATIGYNYVIGKPDHGFEPEIKAGLELLEKAASAGEIQAYESLGEIYSKGKGVEKNITKAIEFLEYATNQGSLYANALLGEIYLKGQDVPIDIKKGLDLLNYAASKGNLYSFIVLGDYYFSMSNWEIALGYLLGSERFDEPQTLYYLGIMRLYGLGINKNCREALKYFKRVIHKGELGGYAEKGYSMYMNGDLEGAFLYNLVSASIGFENSFLSLAYMYENEMIPDKYKCKKGKEYCAAVYYALAYNNPKAMYKIGNLISKGNEYYKGNYTDAMQYYEKSSSLPESLFALATIYEYGLDVEANLTKSLDMYNNIIELADKGQMDHYAKYPAMIALIRNEVKMSPLIQEIVSYSNSTYQWLSEMFESVSMF